MTDRVLVTGGAQRLGAEIVRCFARAGWEVWCHYQHSAQQAEALCAELRAQGRAAQAVQADLARPADIQALVARIRAQGGALRAVVNNASLFVADTGLDFDAAGAQAQLQVNLVAPLLLGQALAREAMSEGAAAADRCVVHVLDQKVYNLNPDYFSYSVSKLALERAVALQAQSLAPAVRVCGVAPGLMYPSGPQTTDNFARASRVNLLRRAIDPAEVARSCLFLAENRSITGSTLCVDNGQHLVPLERDVMFVADALGGGGEAA